MRKSQIYCKWCDTYHGERNEHGALYEKCPRCGRKKPEPNEPEEPLDAWNKYEMEANPLEVF